MLVILSQILAFILPAQTSLQTWACSCQIEPWLIVDLYWSNSIIFWLEPLLQIFWSANRSSFVFKLWSYPVISITRCLCLLSSSGWVPILTSATFWTGRPIAGLLSDSILHIQNSCELFPWYIMSLTICILCFCQPCSASNMCKLILKFMVYVLRCPDGLDLCLP